MPLSVAGHNVMLDRLAAVGVFVSLSKTTTLTVAAAAASTSVTTARAVKVGDYLSFNNGVNREVRKVTSVAGNVATFVGGLTYAYGINQSVGHAPKLGTDLVEPSGGSPVYARQPITWLAAANENLTVSATLPKFPVGGGNEIGGFGLHSAATAGTFYGSFLTNNIEGFGSQGTYELTDADVNLLS